MSLRRSFDPQSSNTWGWPKDETDPEPLLAARPPSDPLLLHGSDEIVTQPFAQYLRDNHSAINNNLNELDHNFSYSYLTRIFKNLTYTNAKAVVDCTVDAVANAQWDDWCTFAFAQACTDMLDENGHLLSDVEQVLISHPVLAQFFRQQNAEPNKMSAFLISAFFVGLINEPAADKVKEAFPIADNAKCEDSISIQFLLAVNKKNDALEFIDRQTIKSYFNRLREIANNPGYPAKSLQQEVRYFLAKHDLQRTIQRTSDTLVRNAATIVLNEAERVIKNSPENKLDVINSLNACTIAIIQPEKNNISQLQNQAYKMSHRSWGIMLGGAMLALAGVTIALASTATALVSFGALAPVSVLGFTLGASMLVGGIAVGAGVAGATAGITGATLFGMGTKRNKQRKQLRQDMEALAKTVKSQPRAR